MNLEHYYYYFIEALPKSLCDEIVTLGKSKTLQKGLTGGHLDKNKKPITESEKKLDKRNSDITFLDDLFLFKELHPFITEANRRAGWNFEWDFSEACQYTEYNTNQYYGWHCDGWNQPYDKNNPEGFVGKIRKLSMTVSLTDPEEYDGGNLEFDFRNSVDYEFSKESKKVCTEIRPKGSIVIFPSFVWHRVTPVTRGNRKSLVMWSLGQPWK